ncbi:MAG: response regulator [Chloroflexi bacterium]|nr:response regulator [Chloroflexota bacterium]
MASSLRVLLVAEHPESTSYLRRLLKSAQYGVVAEVGMGAEAVVAAREHRPDVIIVGLEEPTARGLRTIESLKLAAAEYPVIAVSSLGDREALRRTMVAGARDYLVRPISADDFRQAVTNVLETERRRSSAEERTVTGNPGEIITVFGAKGGVGRSTLAANLATALAQETHQRVVLIDLDTSLGDVALLMSVAPERTMADLVPHIDRLDSDLLRDFLTVHESGVRVLPAPMRPEEGEAIEGAHIAKVLDVMVKTYDYVVVDTPRTFSEGVLSALDQAHLVLLVASPDIACLKSTKLCLGMMRLWHYSQEKLKLVINYPSNSREVGGQEIEEALDYPIFWKVPYSSAVAAAARRGRPVVLNAPGNSYARNVARLAKVMAGTYRPARGLFARLLERV